MHTSTLDQVLWAAGYIGHVALFLLLMWRSRLPEFPAFSTYIAFQIVTTMVLFADYRYAHGSGYASLYWASVLLDFLLLVCVLSEMAMHLLRPASVWIADSRQRLAVWAGLGLVVALLLTFWVNRLRSPSLLAWQYRGNLFTSIMICELFTAILLTSQQAGVYWRSHLVGIGAGLTIWALLSFAGDALQSHWVDSRHHVLIETGRKLAWLGTLAFWMVTFWRDEPEKEQLSPEVERAILHHANRVSYDLAEALGTRERESR